LPRTRKKKIGGFSIKEKKKRSAPSIGERGGKKKKPTVRGCATGKGRGEGPPPFWGSAVLCRAS